MLPLWAMSTLFYFVLGVLLTAINVRLDDPIFWLFFVNIIVIDRLAFFQGKERAEDELAPNKKKK